MKNRFRGYEKARWRTPIFKYGEFGDFILPEKGSAVWQLADKEFAYA